MAVAASPASTLVHSAFNAPSLEAARLHHSRVNRDGGKPNVVSALTS